jgi:hypothetical protein
MVRFRKFSLVSTYKRRLYFAGDQDTGSGEDAGASFAPAENGLVAPQNLEKDFDIEASRETVHQGANTLAQSPKLESRDLEGNQEPRASVAASPRVEELISRVISLTTSPAESVLQSETSLRESSWPLQRSCLGFLGPPQSIMWLSNSRHSGFAVDQLRSLCRRLSMSSSSLGEISW